jgi:hypothetical protein
MKDVCDVREKEAKDVTEGLAEKAKKLLAV